MKSLSDGYGGLSADDAVLRRRLLTLMALHQESDLLKTAIADREDRMSEPFDPETLIRPAA